MGGAPRAVHQFKHTILHLWRCLYEKSQSFHHHPFMRFDVGRIINGYGGSEKTGVCLMLQDEALLLQRQALLQKSESRLLHRQTYQRPGMLL